ncbi:SDR family NAD(P)-dependent oxidoreductase [Paenibacillus koleovorans]|uniref:SDR family NAD(P)-dependent oxidoreductase n=1 Tax=Paenibacillus koleovorans TaxID=121608 RepID=UPI000FDBA5A3|nr:SDR family oxidoreductase [Paenibacillus koleovorans]
MGNQVGQPAACKLQNRVAIITGSGTGLGQATALQFAREGAIVVLCGRRVSKLEDVKRQIEAAGGRALAVQADVSSESDVDALISIVIKAYGRIDVLINNAAVLDTGKVLDTSLDAWNYQLLNNLTSVFLMMKACLPFMKDRQYGRIVNITSGLAPDGAGGFAAYSASKAGLESLTRSVAGEEGGRDLLINMYDPGILKTEMQASGADPSTAVPGLLRLATLPAHGPNGMLFEAPYLDDGQIVSGI